MQNHLSAELFQHLQLQGAWINLSDRAKFLVTGSDRIRFLNGQMTQNVKKVDQEGAWYTCITNVKGKIQFDAHLHAEENSVWLDSEPDTQETLFLRLDRYLIADDVEIQDVTEAWDLWHVQGNDAASLLSGALPLPANAKFRRNTRIPQKQGLDLWIPREAQWQPPQNATLLGASDFENWRILSGVPRFPQELNEQHFPQEAGLENSTMDFHKGCYQGQEILSRIKMTGKMPFQLVRFETEAPESSENLENKLYLRQAEGEPKALGNITSFTVHPLTNRLVGLAYIRHNADYPFSLLIDEEHLPKIPNEVQLTIL